MRLPNLRLLRAAALRPALFEEVASDDDAIIEALGVFTIAAGIMSWGIAVKAGMPREWQSFDWAYYMCIVFATVFLGWCFWVNLICAKLLAQRSAFRRTLRAAAYGAVPLVGYAFSAIPGMDFAMTLVPAWLLVAQFLAVRAAQRIGNGATFLCFVAAVPLTAITTSYFGTSAGLGLGFIPGLK